MLSNCFYIKTNKDKMNLISQLKRLYFKRLSINNISKCYSKNKIIRKIKDSLKEKIKLKKQRIVNK